MTLCTLKNIAAKKKMAPKDKWLKYPFTIVGEFGMILMFCLLNAGSY